MKTEPGFSRIPLKTSSNSLSCRMRMVWLKAKYRGTEASPIISKPVTSFPNTPTPILCPMNLNWVPYVPHARAAIAPTEAALMPARNPPILLFRFGRRDRCTTPRKGYTPGGVDIMFGLGIRPSNVGPSSQTKTPPRSLWPFGRSTRLDGQISRSLLCCAVMHPWCIRVDIDAKRSKRQVLS